jgi:hypothetical protein
MKATMTTKGMMDRPMARLGSIALRGDGGSLGNYPPARSVAG